VILPEPNKRDLEDLPQEVLDDLEFVLLRMCGRFLTKSCENAKTG
jgi:ATP-dependent Lon protease